MIKSMTSFGRASLEVNNKEYLVEIKTVNHKYNDITIKADRKLSYLEDEIRKLILKYISRGKVEVYIEATNYGDSDRDIRFNRELIKTYLKEIREIATEYNLTNDVSVMEIMKLPDALKVKSVNEIERDEVLECVEHALDNMLEMRAIEGNRIEQDLQKRLSVIDGCLNEIEQKSHGLVEKYRARLKEKIAEICKFDEYDEARVAQEVVIFADKTSIEEEMTRLRSHCNQFRITLDANKNAGKKLDFIVQEMIREANTIAAKTCSLDIINSVIQMKAEIEDIREQVQNIE